MERKNSKSIKTTRKHIDFYLFITVLSLLAFGLLMVLSASSESARYAGFTNGDAYYFFKRQSMWAGISLVSMLFFSAFDYHNFGKLSVWGLGISGLLLTAVLIVGREISGGKRWIYIGPINFQPSEIAKIAIIIFFAYSLSQNPKILDKFWSGLVPYLGILGVVALLLMLEPHLSATVVIVLVGVIMLYVAGAKTGHLLAIALPALGAGLALIFSAEYRLSRVIAFMNPFDYKMDEGWQVIQSLYAIGSGKLFGLGFGNSRQKFLYIPEPHNDFIFSILCEELGLVGALLAIFLFAFLIIRGIMIAIKAKDSFGSLVAIGITAMIGIQVVINIAVVTSTMPVTGMPLPFFSYGGTALLMVMSCMGVMLNISKQTK